MNIDEVNEPIDVDSPLIDPPPKNPPALNFICANDTDVKSRDKINEILQKGNVN